MPAATIFTLLAALVAGGAQIYNSSKEREELAAAGREARGLAAQQRIDVLRQQDVQTGLAEEGLELQGKQLSFNKEESEKNRAFLKEKFGYEKMRNQRNDMLNLVNNNAELKARFAQMFAPRR